MGEDNTKYGEYIRWAKNHPILSRLLFGSVFVRAAMGFVVLGIAFVISVRSCGTDNETAEPESGSEADAQEHQEVIDTERSEFSLAGYEDSALIAAVEEMTGYEYDRRSPLNRIQITYTGSLVTIEETGLCYYTGGCLKVLVNERECTTFKSLRIEPTLRGGNPRDALLASLLEEARMVATRNAHVVASGVKDCLQ